MDQVNRRTLVRTGTLSAGVLLVALIGWFTIASLTNRIGTAVGLVQSSSAELQAAANQQATSAKEQSSAMNEIATTIRELIATSRQIAESAQRVATVAGDTDKSARAGDDTVEKANAAISGIRRQTDLIVSHEGIACSGAGPGRSGFCGIQLCAVNIYVRRGGALALSKEMLGMHMRVGEGSAPAIYMYGQGDREITLRWDGQRFR